LSELQNRFHEVTIGSYPFFRKGKLGVNLVMRTTSVGKLTEVTAAVKMLIMNLDGEVIKLP